MSRPIQKWLSRLLGTPGAASFGGFETFAREAGELSAEVGALPDESLMSPAVSLSKRTGGPLPREATVRFLAVAREAAARTIGLTACDEQLVACCALLSGHAVEMDTGEGKTIVGARAAAGHASAGSASAPHTKIVKVLTSAT
jgi:preprotein translocase subunit SecA